MLGAGGNGMILQRKREIKPLALRATVFHPCWDSGSRRADLVIRRPVAEVLVREVQEYGGPAGEPCSSLGATGSAPTCTNPAWGPCRRRCSLSDQRSLYRAGREVCKVYPKVSRASLDQGTASEALTAYRAQSELHGRRGGARPVPPGMLRGQIHSQM